MRIFPVLLAAPFLAIGCGLDAAGLLEAPGDAGDDASLASDAMIDSADDSAEASSGDDVGADTGRDTGGDTGGDGSSGGDAGNDSTVLDASDATPPMDVVTEDSPPPPPTYPSSCGQTDAGSGQSVTLYYQGDPNKPYSAVCVGSTTYVALAHPSTNVSSYPAGGCASVESGKTTWVTTTWSMLKIDPGTLVVDTSDFAGATSAGGTHEVSGNGSYVHDYTQMPYAAARTCDDQAHATPFATIDLTGTAFAVAATQAWQVQGFSNANPGGAPFSSENPASGKTVDLYIGGFPAGISPCNDYYQTTGGSCLQLVYSP